MTRDLVAEIAEKTGFQPESLRVTFSRIKRRHDLKSIAQAACYYVKTKNVDINVSSIIDEVTRQVLRDEKSRLKKPTASAPSISEQIKPKLTAAPKVRWAPQRFYGISSRLADLYPYLFIFENALRNLIDDNMKKSFGSSWWDTKLKHDFPEFHRYVVDERAKQAKLPIVGKVLTLTELECLTIGHLEQIIQKYDSLFIPSVFPNLHFFTGHMIIVKYVRNALAHMSPAVTARDIRNAKHEIDILLQHMASV